MGEFHVYSPGGSKRHMSASSSAKMRNDAKAVVKSAKISSTNKVNKGEAVAGKPTGNGSDDVASSAESSKETAVARRRVTESNKENVMTPRRKKLPSPSVFGYDIDDINNFLSQATARTPANIPMVVTSRTELYVLEPAATPEEPTVPIHLGLVVNALFKHRQWLYVHTPHSQEGYLAYSACTPLGIIPRAAPTASWEDAACSRLPRRSSEPGAEPGARARSSVARQEAPERPPCPPPAAKARSPLRTDVGRDSGGEGAPPPPRPPLRQLAQTEPGRERGEERPQRRRHRTTGAADGTALDARVNKTDSEKLYENVTADGRALGLLLELHLRRGRARSQQRGRSQSAGREPTRRAGARPRRDQSAPTSGPLVAAHDKPDGLDRSRPSAFHRLKPSSPPATKSLEALRRAEVAPPRGRLVAPRSNNKAVIWEEFVSRGRNTLTVIPGDIVILLNTSVGDWFWVKDAVGREGYIPSVCVGSGLH